VAARVRRMLRFAAEKLCYGMRYLYGFLDGIDDNQDLNLFLIHIRFYVTKIRKKIKKG
jgi:hypothetical protein